MMTLELDRFLAELARVRRAQGVSQADIARALGVHRETISRWERGYRVPQDARLRRWVALLGIDMPAGVRGAEDRRYALQPCGTYGAAQRHVEAGMRLQDCPPCLEAYNAYHRQYARRKRGKRVTA